MKKNEKILILTLIIILLIICVLVVRRNKKTVDYNDISDVVLDEDYFQPETDIEEIKAEKPKYLTVLEDGVKLNTSTTLNSNKTVDGLEFSNIQLTYRNGQSVLLAEVKNTGTTATKITLVDVIILDENGGEVGKIGGIIGPLEPGGSTQFNSSTTVDFSNAYDFKIVKSQ